MYNEGVPATSSETFEPCVESIVPQVGCCMTGGSRFQAMHRALLFRACFSPVTIVHATCRMPT